MNRDKQGIQGYSSPQEDTTIFSSKLSPENVIEWLPTAKVLVGCYKGQLEVSYAVDTKLLWNTSVDTLNQIIDGQESYLLLKSSIACNHRPAFLYRFGTDEFTPQRLIREAKWVSRPREWAVKGDYTFDPQTGTYWVLEDKDAPTSAAEAWTQYANNCAVLIEKFMRGEATALHSQAIDLYNSRHPLTDLGRPARSHN